MDKTAEGGQPSLAKLEAEQVSPRKCLAMEGQPGYGGSGGGSSMPMMREKRLGRPPADGPMMGAMPRKPGGY
jgi:hypothetical protein